MQPGFVIAGKYELIAPLGEGGMGIVWRARHVGLGRDVALKLIHRDALSATTVERFLREARNAAAVRHPNVLDVTDVGMTEHGEPYLVMELLDGESLGARLGRAPMSVAEVVRAGAGILRGLAAVHDAGLLHRDLKPDNVFLAREADETVVKLVDFGISKNVEDPGARAKLTQTGTIVGTPHYMSVEQLCGARDLDARSDLFSVGVILYEALARQLPHDGDSLTAVIAAKLEREPDALAVLRPDVPLPLCTVVHRALARKREERFASAAQMREALLAAAATWPPVPEVASAAMGHARTVQVAQAPPVGRTPLTPMAVSAPHTPHAAGPVVPTWVGLAALAALGLAVAGGGLLWLTRRGRVDAPTTIVAATPAPPAPLGPTVAHAAPEPSGWAVGPASSLASLAIMWRALGPSAARDAVRFTPAGPDAYVPVLPAGLDEAQAATAVLAFGGPASPAPAPASDALAPVLLWTTGSLHVRAGPSPSAADVSALQARVLLVGLRGMVGGTPSAIGAPTDWSYVVVDAHEAGWSSAAYLEPYTRCMPALGLFLAELPEARRSTLAADVYVRALPALLIGPRRGLGYLLTVHDAVDGRSYVGVFSATRGCTLERLGLYREGRVVESVSLIDAAPSVGPVLVVLRGPALDAGLDGAERWQAFPLGSTDEVWRAVLPSSDALPRSRRANVSFSQTSRYGLPGHWPVRVRSGEAEQFYRWDGSALVLDP